LARVNSYLARILLGQAEYEQAVTACERAIAIARSLNDYGSEVLASHFLGLAYYCLGNYRKAVEAQRGNLVPLDSPVVCERFGGVVLVFAVSRISIAVALAERGEFIEAIARGTEAVQIAEAVDHPSSVTVTYRGLGLLHLRRGDVDQATRALEHALEICRGVDSPPLFHAVRSTLGYAYGLSGRSAEAIPLLEQAVDRPVLGATQEGQSLRTIWLSEGYLLAGRVADARAAAQRVLALARWHKERGHEAYTLRLLGEIAAREDPLDIEEAENHYRQALAVAEELGMRPLIAHCHVGLGKLYRRAANYEKAKTHLPNGVAMMREMEMGLWMERAEEDLKDLGLMR
jgi:tetratricopeptide (TPR) repeat protein